MIPSTVTMATRIPSSKKVKDAHSSMSNLSKKADKAVLSSSKKIPAENTDNATTSAIKRSGSTASVSKERASGSTTPKSGSTTPKSGSMTPKSVSTASITKDRVSGSTTPKSGLVGLTKQSDDDLREVVARLESELAAERASRQKKIHQIHLQMDQEHARASVALKDVRAKLLTDKTKELDLQREALQRKHENELSKAVKQREAEVQRIRAELNKCSAQLNEYNNNGGLSQNQRHAFEAERSRLAADLQELRGQKRRLEDLVRTAQEAEKQMAGELRQAHEQQKAEAARIRRDADAEIKKLLEELKNKDRLIVTLEKDSGVIQAKETIAKQQNMILTLATEMAVWENEKKAGQQMSMSMESNDSAISTTSTGSSSGDVAGGGGGDAAHTATASEIEPPPDPGKSPPHTAVVDPDRVVDPESSQLMALKETEGTTSTPRQQQADGDQSETSYQAMSELRVQLRKAEDAVTNLTQDKLDLMKRIKDLEKKFKQSQEKNRKFLEKNMDLTNINRNLEEKIRKLTEDNTKLKSTVEKSKKETTRLNNRLHHDKQGKEVLDVLQEEMHSMKQQAEDSNKTIEALKLACAEKDRRIELLAHRRKKQRATKQQQKVVRFKLPSQENSPDGAAGLKETYYGYDEDSKSLDSENLSLSSSRMSSSRVSLENSPEYDDASDDVFDEFTREEFEKNYQRLAKEHLELEKSFALLQSQNGPSHIDPQRESKMRCQLESDLLDAQTKIEDLEKIVQEKGTAQKREDTSWVEEKEILNKNIRKLKEKLTSIEETKLRLKAQITELTEQNEVLEFRLLELEECNDKLSEEVGAAMLMSQHCTVSGEGGVWKIFAGDGAVHEINVEELKDKLMQLRNTQSIHPSERLVLLQTRAMVDMSLRRIAELSNAESVLNQRIAQLEKEKAQLLAKETGLETDLILEYEETRNKLIQAELRINNLSQETEELQKSLAVYRYKEECNDKTDRRYRDEIAGLRRQVSASSEGRQHESELWADKCEQLKQAESMIQTLQTERAELQSTIKDLQKEVTDLTEQLETQSMTESDNDNTAHLKAKIMEREKSNAQLVEEIAHLKARLEESDQNEGDLTEQNLQLQDDMEAMQKRCNILQNELDVTEEELESAHQKCSHLEQEVYMLQEKCTSTERELQLACLAIEKAKTNAEDVETDSCDDKKQHKEGNVQSQKEVAERTDEMLKREIDGLRDSLTMKDKIISDLKRTKEVYEKEEEDLSYLKEHLQEREKEIEELQNKVHKFAESEEESSEHILELLETKDQLEEDLKEFRSKEGSSLSEDETAERTRLQTQVQKLQAINTDLEASLTSLRANHNQCNIQEHNELDQQITTCKATIEKLKSDSAEADEKHKEELETLREIAQGGEERTSEEELRVTIKELEEDLEQARTQFEEAHEEFDNHDEELQKRIRSLEQQVRQLQDKADDTDADLNLTLYEKKIEELERDLKAAQERTQVHQEGDGDTKKNADELTDKLKLAEENEKKLGETIEDLKDIEKGLKGRIVEREVDITEMKKMMDENKHLREQIRDLEYKLKECDNQPEYHFDAGLKQKLAKYEETMKEMMTTVDELTAKESDLMKENYEMKMENQELKEHIDDLIEDRKNEPLIDSKTEVELQEKLRKIQEENKELKDKAFRAKLDRLDTISEDEEEDSNVVKKDLQNRIQELEKNEKDLKENIRQANAEIEALNVVLQDNGVKTKKLLDKLEVLESSEDKLMEQLDIQEERNEKLVKEIEILRKNQSTHDSGIGLSTVDEAGEREHRLQMEIDRLREEIDRGIGLNDKEELVQLRNKVDILIDTEDKLIDRLQSQEMVEIKLKEHIRELESQLEHEKRIHVDESKEVKDYLRTIEELKDSEHSLKSQVSQLEKSEVELLAKFTGLSSNQREVEGSNAELYDQISKLKHIESTQNNQISELENTVMNLRRELKEMESDKKGLISTLEAIGQKKDLPEVPKLIADSSLLSGADPEFSLGPGDPSLISTSHVPLDLSTIEKMSREEMMSNLRELERMERYHRAKIQALNENLDELRNAVEVVAVTMETDAGIPIIKYRPKLKDSEFEARVHELVASESALKIRVMELEKREIHLKRELIEAESLIKEQERDFKDELDELEDELNDVRKNEAKLKTKLQYSGANIPPTAEATVAKITHLEELVCDLENGETKLKRQVQELKRNEDELRSKLSEATSGGKNGITASTAVSTGSSAWEEKERKFTQEQRIRQLEEKERELEEEVEILRRDDTSEKLAKRVSELQRSEKGLRLKVDLLEAQGPSDLSFTGNMLESPEDILRQRIRELEKMEKHHKQQIAELEKDREELHEIARGDKNTIHDLSVQLRELQLRDKTLKEQLNRCEQSESLLQLRCDDLSERTEELEEKLRSAISAERSSRAQLAKHHHAEKDLSIKLEHSQEDLQSTETKLKTRIEELQRDKRDLRDKCDELLDRIGDLEGAELTLKQKIRHIENNETQIKGRLNELEQREHTIEQRKQDLEHCNDTLTDKIHHLEEEKSNLLYSLSDLEIAKEESVSENTNLKSKIAALERKLAEYEKRKEQLESRLDEYTSKEVQMQSKLGEVEKKSQELLADAKQKAIQESNLKKRVGVLEKECVETDEKARSRESLEKQISFIQSQLDYHQRSHSQVDAENTRLREKLHRYEHASTDNSMVQVPKDELLMLRKQEDLLEDLEKKVEKLEGSEKSLKAAVEKLREGKDACGHEYELSDLKSKVNDYNAIIKAYELQKRNHEETKQQLQQLQARVKSGDIVLKDPVTTTSKNIQVHLAETINFKGVTPEFKNALRSLGTRYPRAYDEFVQNLTPHLSTAARDERQVSHVRVEAVSSTMASSPAEEAIIAADTAAQRQQKTPSGTSHSPAKRPLDTNSEERSALIGGLVDTMTTDHPLWQRVEGKKSQSGGGADGDYWEELEKNMGETDDMMLTINFGDEEDSDRPRSAASSVGSVPPPLPGSMPPAYIRARSQSPADDSYYLPSADEASEIADDDDFRQRRGRSLEPDSAYSEGLPTLGMGRPPTRKNKKGKRMSASLESIADDSGFQDVDVKILREKIASLEEQVKVKENEVKVAHEVGEVKSMEELMELKNKLDEKENQLDLEKKVNQEQMDKLSRTVQELNQVKAEMEKAKAKSLDPIIPTPDTSLTLHLKESDESATNQVLLQAQLDRKERELEAKANEVDRLSTELRRWQNDCREARDESTEARDRLNSLEALVESLKKDCAELSTLQAEHTKLEAQYADLESRWQGLQSAGEEKSALEKIVLKLRGQLKDLERIDLERNDLETKVKALETELKEKNTLESQYAKEVASLQHRLDELTKQHAECETMRDNYNAVRSKFDEMERLKSKAQLAITPLRAKVLRLAHKCKIKDELLREMVAALPSRVGNEDVVTRADSSLTQSAAEEYHRPISPVTARALQEFEKECGTLSASSAKDPMSLPTPAPRRPPRRAHRLHSLETTSEESDDYVDTHPANGADDELDELLSRQPVTQLSVVTAAAPRVAATNGHHGPKYQHGGMPLLDLEEGKHVSEMYKAVKDYNPEHFSRSGHQRLELPLTEGEVVKALGPVDDRGYFEAQVGGKVGLVPVTYLVPLVPSPPKAQPSSRRAPRLPPVLTDTSPEQILALHQQLQRAHTPNHQVSSPTATITHPAFARALSPRQPKTPPTAQPRLLNGTLPLNHSPAAPFTAPVAVAPPTGPLDPPSDLRIHRVVGDHSLLVSWVPPPLDEFGHNHGTAVRGYKIFINSKDRQTVPSAHMTKALVEKLNLHRPQSFSIQTVGENNRVSRLTDTVMFEDVLPEEGTSQPEESHNGDVHSVVSNATESAERKVNVALYDYIPSPQAPHPSQHLSFNAGDIVVTYGNVHPDGLYNGKVNGKRGLVPASFIEEVALQKSKGRRSGSSSAMSLFSPSSSVTGSANVRSPSHSSITSSASRRSAHRI